MTSRAPAINLLRWKRKKKTQTKFNAGRTETSGKKVCNAFFFVNCAEIVNITHMAENINEAFNACRDEEINLLHVPAFRKAKT